MVYALTSRSPHGVQEMAPTPRIWTCRGGKSVVPGRRPGWPS